MHPEIVRRGLKCQGRHNAFVGRYACCKSVGTAFAIYRSVPHGPIAGATEWLLIGAAAQRQPVWELSRTSIEVFH